MSEGDRRLGLQITASGADAAAAEIRRLEEAAKSLARTIREAESFSGRDMISGRTFRLPVEQINKFRTELAGLNARLLELRGTENQVTASINAGAEAFSRQARAAEMSAAQIIRAQRGIETAANERVVGRFLSTSQLLSAQRGARGIESIGMSGRMANSADIIRAQAAADATIAYLRKAEKAEQEVNAITRARSGGRTFYQSQDTIAARLGLDRDRDTAHVGSSSATASSAIRQRQHELEEAFGNSGARAGAGFVTRFLSAVAQLFSSGRALTLVDEGVRGQRRQFIASTGSAIRNMGLGGAGVGVAIGGFAAVGGAEAIAHEAQVLGRWAEQVKAASQATGISVQSYSQLQGALVLTGAKAESADSAMRQFANHLEQAAANPASRAAKALHALGISEDEIKTHGNDALYMFMRIADQWNKFADGANKSAAGEALFGRSLEEVTRLLSRGSEGTQALMNQAQALGITLTDQTAAALSDTNQKLTTLEQKLRGEVIQAFVEWKPEIDSAIAGITILSGFVSSFVGILGQLDQALAASGGLLGIFANVAIPGFGMIKGFYDRITSSSAIQRIYGILGLDVPSFGSGNVEGSPSGGHMDLDVPITAKAKVPAFDVPKGGAGANKEITSDIDALRKSLQGLRDDYRLVGAQQDAFSEHQRLATRIAQADKDISPQQRAKEDYVSFQQAASAKQAALSDYQSKTDAVYDQIIAKAAEVYKQDPKLYKEAIQEKINADKDFLVQHTQIQNQVDSKFLEVIQTYQQAVQQVISQWGNAFDQIGDKLESTIETAIKSAFEPMKPEYWWSTVQGPHGQPLMQSHRINPTTQLLGGFGMSALGDLGKTFLSSITGSIGKSIFGEGTASFGQGLAKMLGFGSSDGFLGTGLGAVSKVATSQATSAVTNVAAQTGVGAVTNVATETPEVTAITAMGSAITTAIGSSTATIVGALQELVATTTATAVKPSVLGTTYGFGGIVPSAAGGWVVPPIGGGIPSLLHAREMVLPAHISEGLQSMIESGNAGGESHLHAHFHGPADAPSISRWFNNMIASNPNAIRNLFRQNALTPRTF